MAGQLQTVEQVAKMLNVHVRTVQRLLLDKAIVGYKVRGVWRIDPQSVDAYMKDRCNIS